jgi:hypothetical protein
MDFEQSEIIVDYLMKIADTSSKQFTVEKMIVENKGQLKFETSPRYLRDLRFKGLVKYEVPIRRAGLYNLVSTFQELRAVKRIIADRGYDIDAAAPVITVNNFAFLDKQQVSLF